MNKLIFIILAYISYILLTLVFGKIGRTKFKSSIKNYLIIIVFTLLNSISFADDLLFLKTIISILIFILLNLLIYKKTFKQSIITSLIYLIMTLFTELVVLLVLSPFDIISDNYITSISTLKAAITVMVMLVTYLFISIKIVDDFIYKVYSFLVNDKKYTKYIIIAIILVTFICLLYIINYSEKNLFIMNVLFYIGFIAVIYLISKSVYRNNKLNIVNQLLINNEESYIKALESYQLFKHNIIHELNCIKSVGNKKVNKIIDGYIEEHKTPTIDKKIMVSIPKSIRTILYNSIIKNSAYTLDINVDNYIKNDIINELSTNKYIKFCQVLGIVIDNSIEASKNINYIKPYIYLYLNEDKNCYYIKVVNAFNNDIFLFESNRNNKSTKKGHDGLGIKYINNTKFDIKSIIRNDKFITSMVIKK